MRNIHNSEMKLQLQENKSHVREVVALVRYSYY